MHLVRTICLGMAPFDFQSHMAENAEDHEDGTNFIFWFNRHVIWTKV